MTYKTRNKKISAIYTKHEIGNNLIIINLRGCYILVDLKELNMLLEEVLKAAHQNRREEADWLASNQGSD